VTKAFEALKTFSKTLQATCHHRKELGVIDYCKVIHARAIYERLHPSQGVVVDCGVLRHHSYDMPTIFEDNLDGIPSP